MTRRRDPKFKTGHLCRFCGGLISWEAILRLIRVDPDTPGYMLNESACHTECLMHHLRPGTPLTFHRRWEGRPPMPEDDADVDGKPCAMCGLAIAPATLVRLRVQKPVGPIRKPEFDEQTLPLHFDCLAAVSNSRFG